VGVAAFLGMFLAGGWFRQNGVISSRPPAGNANRWVAIHPNRDFDKEPEEKKMSFVSSIIVVEEIARSRILYESILHLKVTADFGIYNVGFEGGLSLYRKAFFEELIGGQVHLARHNNVVLYFEVDDLEELEEKVAQSGFEFIHKIREQPWKQRNFRFYDYDQHVLEIAEKMDVVIDRLRQNGSSVEEIANLTGYSVEQVIQEIEKHKERG
jgi:catechol 2,3-dioxygenase-like lactoylglutathione lyase family enzyme